MVRSKVLGPSTRQRIRELLVVCLGLRFVRTVGLGVYSAAFEIKALLSQNVKFREKGRTSKIQRAADRGTDVSSERSHKELCCSSERSLAQRSCFKSLEEHFPHS